ncbi:NEP1-interacting protein-like 2 isoform X2 [Rhodamnia argentea]|uniref:NEP1-interacting protein-like 2 isoform X2 n=1 Tax=Rhodamnia argentea TaxID=178133 RepID=A0ABM3HM27_9MYRT|nr:NEP1-interacting protein-like 2 isoform X2 [Rhodamnia argentea]
MEVAFRCTCSRYRADLAACSFCGAFPLAPEEPHDWPAVGRLLGGAWGFRHVLWLAIAVLLGPLVGLFALGGAFLGAIAGALAGRASNRGLIQGAVLGAIAGAVLSMEVLETSRAYWCREQTDVDDDSWRFIEIPDVYDELVSRGLSQDALKRLPSEVIMEDMKAMQSICCAICLQDIEVGETVRSLPLCHHVFHLTCVDKWLLRCGSCPVCRQHVKCKALCIS